MKLNRLLFCTAFLLFSIAAHSQAPPASSFGGFHDITPDIRDEITPAQRQMINKSIQENIVMLAKKGITAESSLKKGPITTKFGWPLRKADGFNDHSYYGISNYVDVDPTTGIKDYNCGRRTYDGHMGTDIFTAPFWWKKMDNNSVEIVAAADGIIVAKASTREDKNCAMCAANAPSECFLWNAIYVQHADGTVAWYGHMKKNSPTAKVLGDVVSKGEYLGVVGSSGSSSGPHLHFEVWEDKTFTKLLNPWQGTCNPDQNESMWEAQQPYYKPEIIKVMSGTAVPEIKDCYGGKPENTNESNNFILGKETVFVTTFIRDNLPGGSGPTFWLFRPDGSTQYNWSANPYNVYYASSYFYYTFPPNELNKTGDWTFRVAFNKDTSDVTFRISSVAPLDLVSFTANKKGDNVLLQWQTQNEQNTDYVIIERSAGVINFETIGNISTTGNGKSAINDYLFTDQFPQAGDQYYRLKMVDKDGKFTYSKIEKVNMVKMNAVKVFPNPATNIVTLQGVKNYSRVRISNLQGSELMSKSFEGDELKLNISNLPAGVYLLQLGNQTFDYNVKLIKK